ncbi:MAG: acetylxylan esterase [Planctomycetaceae bacterium]
MYLRNVYPAILFAIAVLLSPSIGLAQDPESDPQDPRLSAYRNIYDKFHPWTPPNSLDEWKQERNRIRTQLLVSNGLWPMPPKSPITPRLGRIIQRDGYVVQHAMFESMPGHYVTGVIYRPQEVEGKLPAVLCPHGHWQNGRFYDAGDKKTKEQLDKTAEAIPAAARHPLQARFVQLARMGCLVFHYDMVGYADSNVIEHRQQFNDANAMLWLTNKMGLQTWNSLRALDFVSSLESVDPNRIAVTGSSGGGTQTFMLAAIERDRIAAAFPAVMVSTGMQGGCVCENASYLRVGVNNVALAALFAPKPMAMSGADDWTIDIQKLGLPELRQVYSLYGKPTLVNAQAWPEFKHNYNMHSRHMMYRWFNEHLNLGNNGSIEERNFQPLIAEEQSVFSSIPQPNDPKSGQDLRKDLQAIARNQFGAMFDGSPDEVKARYEKVMRPLIDVVFDVPELTGGTLAADTDLAQLKPGVKLEEALMANSSARGRDGKTHRIKLAIGSWQGTNAVHWVDGAGVDDLIQVEAFRKLCDQTAPVTTSDYFAHNLSVDEIAKIRGSLDNNQNYAGLTYCYNLPTLAERVRDVACLLSKPGSPLPESMTVVGTGKAGPIVLLATAATKRKVDRVIVDLNGFSFGSVKAAGHEMMLPGAMRYGDIGGLAALAFPCHMQLFGTEGIPEEALAPLKRIAKLTGSKLELFEESLSREKVVELVGSAKD